MEILANMVARWFVQGEHYRVQVTNDTLIFESATLKETVPFGLWDGVCHLERGLIWGCLQIEVMEDNQLHRLSGHGFAWVELVAFSHVATERYQHWHQAQAARFAGLAPLLQQQLSAIEHTPHYLRHSDLTLWCQQIETLLVAHDFPLVLIHAYDPQLHQQIIDWMYFGDKTRAKFNANWQQSQVVQWQSWFEKIASSPLNPSQCAAVLLDDDVNLLLAGAGSGKTAVLMAKVQYLLASEQTQAERILLLAFGKKASQEMIVRLNAKGITGVDVATFHGLALRIVQDKKSEASISPLATDEETKLSWLTSLLTEHFASATVQKRWLTHLASWPIARLDAKQSLEAQCHDYAFQQWVWRQIDLLASQPSQAQVKQQIETCVQARSEYQLIQPLFRAYLNQLAKEKAHDFHQIIHLAAKDLASLPQWHGKYSHIMVDEYQDISPARLALLTALYQCQSSPLPVDPNLSKRAAALFAVGDDWQAIYRFTGADVNLTTGFLNRFAHGQIAYLDTTYRFNSQIGAVANRFIQQNPYQLNKPLISHNTQSKKAVHIINMANLIKALEQLDAKGQKYQRIFSVMLIGRQHAHKPNELYCWQQRFKALQLAYITAHASKGMEADYCFIVNLNDHAFPTTREPNGLEACLLSETEPVEFAEERRLFYVALTRARHEVWLCTEPHRASPFILELIQQGYPVRCELNKKGLLKAATAPVD